MCGQPTLPLDFGSSRPRYWFLLRRSILRSHLSHCQINMDMAFMASQHFRFHLGASQIQICCHIWQVWHARKVQPSGQLAIIRFCFLTKAKYPLTGNIHTFWKRVPRLQRNRKKMNFPQICPKMPQNDPKMAKNDPKWPKVAQIWPKMALEWPKMIQNGPKITPNGPKLPPNGRIYALFPQFFFT